MTDLDDCRARALRRLPPSHAFAIRLQDEGASTTRMARLLGIDQTAVQPLLEIALAKLAELERDEIPTRDRSPGSGARR